MQLPDIIAWQIDGYNVAIGYTDRGVDELRKWDPECFPHIPSGQGEEEFIKWLSSFTEGISIGVLDPTGKLLNFRSGVLH